MDKPQEEIASRRPVARSNNKPDDSRKITRSVRIVESISCLVIRCDTSVKKLSEFEQVLSLYSLCASRYRREFPFYTLIIEATKVYAKVRGTTRNFTRHSRISFSFSKSYSFKEEYSKTTKKSHSIPKENRNRTGLTPFV